MMATTHILAGAAVARLGRRWWVAWPAAFASYFLLDVIPHVNVEQFLHYPAKGWVTLLDAVVGLVLIERMTRRHRDRGLLLGGVAVVLLAAAASNVSHALAWFSHAANEPLVLGPAHLLGACLQLLVLGGGLYAVGRTAR